MKKSRWRSKQSRWDTPSRLNDKLSIAVFIASSYIALNLLIKYTVYDVLGIIFIAAALYGFISLAKDIHYIFS